MMKMRMLYQNRLCRNLFLFIFICYVAILQNGFNVNAQVSNASSLTDQANVLLSFKKDLVDDGILSSWNSSNLAAVCKDWEGVVCNTQATEVIGLDFNNLNLNGTFTDAICGIKNLTTLDLRYNNFNQSFPYFLLENGCGSNLQFLDLSQNWFYGTLPPNISILTNLEFFSLESNSFTGYIPADYGKLKNLNLLRLRGNTGVIGNIPAELSNLTSLEVLDLAYIEGLSGPIPSDFEKLLNLNNLDLQGNQLNGSVPSGLSHLNSMVKFDLSGNQLSGDFPSSIAPNLTKLTQFYLYNNKFSGPLPTFSKAHTSLRIIQLDNNSFTGSIPEVYGELTSLYEISLTNLKLTGSLPESIALLPNLTTLDLYRNSLSGELSSEWGLHSASLQQFDVSYNNLSGQLPPNLCSKPNDLIYISFQNNLFSGGIPSSYADCQGASRMLLNDNQLNGTVPTGLWTHPSLDYLNLQNNFFSGKMNIQSSQSNLSIIFIDNNQFEGQIPSEITLFSRLVKFTATSNNFSGPIPDQIGLIKTLQILNLTSNSISGEIPSSIGNCTALSSLSLSHNQLSGPIPAELSELQVLNYLDLSYNHLNGTIPSAIQSQTTYVVFDVAYNDLSGDVSQEFVYAYGSQSFVGNTLLCYTNACTMQSSTYKNENSKSKLLKIVAGTVIGACALIVLVAVCFCIQSKKEITKNKVVDWQVVAFQKLDFDEEKVFENLDECNVIGSGGTGKVYKVIFPGGPTVAVKKLQCAPSSKPRILAAVSRWDHHNHHQRNSNAFKTEMETLGKIKHRNIVKLLCCCESEETKLLVYEYMPFGSLADILHKSFNNLLTNWNVRYKIAFGTAEGLSYLHYDCVPMIIHRDIKSNNILLAPDFNPKIADFGVAKDMKGKITQMTSVVGSVGYIAPEYAYSLKANEKSDVYSYGVVLLELITGRTPTCREFEEMAGPGVDLVRWAHDKMLKYENKVDVWKIFDTRIEITESDKESMLTLLRIALHCTCALPQKRPSMREVVELLRRAAPSSYHEDKDQKHVVLSIDD